MQRFQGSWALLDSFLAASDDVMDRVFRAAGPRENTCAAPKVTKDLRGPLEPEVSVVLEEPYPVYVSATLI